MYYIIIFIECITIRTNTETCILVVIKTSLFTVFLTSFYQSLGIKEMFFSVFYSYRVDIVLFRIDKQKPKLETKCIIVIVAKSYPLVSLRLIVVIVYGYTVNFSLPSLSLVPYFLSYRGLSADPGRTDTPLVV